MVGDGGDDDGLQQGTGAVLRGRGGRGAEEVLEGTEPETAGGVPGRGGVRLVQDGEGVVGGVEEEGRVAVTAESTGKLFVDQVGDCDGMLEMRGRDAADRDGRLVEDVVAELQKPALGGQVGAGAGCWLRGSQVRGAGAAVSAGAVGAAGVLGAGPGVAVAAGPGGAGEGPLVALVAGVHEVGAVRDADPVQGRGPRRAPGAVLGQTRRTVAGGGMRPPALVAAGEVLLDQAWEVVPAGRGARGGGGRTQGELHRAR